MAALCETTHSKRVIKIRHLTAHPKCRLRYTLCVASCLIILHTKPTPKDGFYNVAVVPIWTLLSMGLIPTTYHARRVQRYRYHPTHHFKLMI